MLRAEAHLWRRMVCDLLEVVEGDDRLVAGDHAHYLHLPPEIGLRRRAKGHLLCRNPPRRVLGDVLGKKHLAKAALAE